VSTGSAAPSRDDDDLDDPLARSSVHTVFSRRYPPKHREGAGVSDSDMEFEDSHGRCGIDSNGARLLAFNRRLPVKGPGQVASVLSGEPGYIVRTHEVELALTAEEILRLLRYDLTRSEVLRLLAHFGAFFEIGDDFYDETTGESRNPM